MYSRETENGSKMSYLKFSLTDFCTIGFDYNENTKETYRVRERHLNENRIYTYEIEYLPFCTDNLQTIR